MSSFKNISTLSRTYIGQLRWLISAISCWRVARQGMAEINYHNMDIFSWLRLLWALLKLRTWTRNVMQKPNCGRFETSLLQGCGLSNGRYPLVWPRFTCSKIDIFLFLEESIRCGYSLEAPHNGASNEHPCFLQEIRTYVSRSTWPPLGWLGRKSSTQTKNLCTV